MKKNIINELDEIVKKESRKSGNQKKENMVDKTKKVVTTRLENQNVAEVSNEQREKIKVDKFDFATNDYELILNTLRMLSKDSEIEKFFDKLCSNNVFKKNIISALNVIKQLYSGEWIDFLLLIYKKMNHCSIDTNIAGYVHTYMVNECELLLKTYNIIYDLNFLKDASLDVMNRFVDMLLISELKTKYVILDKSGDTKIDELRRNAEVIKISFLCLMIMNNAYKGYNHKKSIIIERFINEKFAPIDEMYYINNCTSFTLDAITKTDYKDRLKGLKYLYYSYCKENEKLVDDNNKLNIRINNLINDNTNLKLENERLHIESESFKSTEADLKNEVENIKKIQERTAGNIEFIESQLKIQYNSMKQSLLKNLKKELSYEIDNINELISNLDERTKIRLKRQVDRILETIDEKLGD